MSISEMLIKGIGIVLVLVGFGLVLGAVGVTSFGAGLGLWVGLVLGFVLMGIGIFVVRGGNITL